MHRYLALKVILEFKVSWRFFKKYYSLKEIILGSSVDGMTVDHTLQTYFR